MLPVEPIQSAFLDKGILGIVALVLGGLGWWLLRTLLGSYDARIRDGRQTEAILAANTTALEKLTELVELQIATITALKVTIEGRRR